MIVENLNLHIVLLKGTIIFTLPSKNWATVCYSNAVSMFTLKIFPYLLSLQSFKTLISWGSLNTLYGIKMNKSVSSEFYE